MKTIQPVSIWFNGQSKLATKFQLTSINDNLSDTATFYYQLFCVSLNQDGTESDQQVSDGNLTMTGQVYQDWDASPNINDAAYTWAAAQLGLTIVA